MNINSYLAKNPVNCTRGAPMGSASFIELNNYTPLHLQQVRIDSQGYAPDGTYWGIGETLWCAYDEDDYCRLWVRAPSRRSAIEKLSTFDNRLMFKRGAS
jgi:hypothetical protein